MMAEQRKLDNFCVLSLHKLVPPVLRALLDDKDGCGVQAFLLPGHVSTILGLEPYGFLASEYRVPAVVGGFEPVDILQALCTVSYTHLRKMLEAWAGSRPRARKMRGMEPPATAPSIMSVSYTHLDVYKRQLQWIFKQAYLLPCKCLFRVFHPVTVGKGIKRKSPGCHTRIPLAETKTSQQFFSVGPAYVHGTVLSPAVHDVIIVYIRITHLLA